MMEQNELRATVLKTCYLNLVKLKKTNHSSSSKAGICPDGPFLTLYIAISLTIIVIE